MTDKKTYSVFPCSIENNQFWLELHARAKNLAFEELEKELKESKDWDALKKLEKIMKGGNKKMT